jgi:hypothetical protein
MPSIYYSKSSKGFYRDTIHKVLPADAVLVDAAQYAALLAAQEAGCPITADNAGRPASDSKPSVNIKALAMDALNKSDTTLLRCLEHGVEIPSVWAVYRDALREVIQGSSTALPERPPYPQGS